VSAEDERGVLDRAEEDERDDPLHGAAD